MVVEYIADTSKLVSSVKNVKSAAEEGAASLRNMATAGAAVATAALIGVGVASVKMAGDFQAGITSLETGAGELHSNLAMVGDGIKQIAIDTGTSTKDLTSAMFMIDSSSIHGADSLKVLAAAAEGAKTDNADLTTTTMALTTVLHDYHLPASDAAAATNEIIAAAKAGKMHMQDLAASLGSVLPIAQNAHVSFADVGGAIAMMTNAGKDAQVSAQNLSFLLRSFEAPSGVAQKSMKAVGLSAQDLKDTLTNKGLPAALQLVEDHIANKFPAGSIEATTALKNIAGGAAGLNVALTIGGANMADYKKNVDSINAALHAGGSSVEGWATVQGNFNTKIAQAQATIEVLGINIGTKLLPVLGKALDAFSSPAFQQFATVAAGVLTSALLGLINGVSTLVQWGTQLVAFFQHNQAAMATLQVVVATLAGAILGALVVAFAMGAAAAASTAIAFLSVAWPVILIVAAVAGLGVGLYLLYQRFAPVREVVDSVGKTFQMLWQTIVSALMPAWVELQGAINNAIPMFQFLGVVLLGTIVVVIGIVIAAIEGLAVGIGFAVTGIVNIITGLIDIFNGVFQVLAGIIFFFKDLFTGNFSQLGADLGLIWRGIINIFVGAWDIIKGVFVTVGGFIVGFLGGFVVGIIQFFQHLFDVLVGHSIIPDMINGIISWFLQLPGRAGAAIQSMITNVLNLLGGLVTSALNAGSNIVKGIADGITAGLHWISGAITNVTQFISDHLPHSPAKMGPLIGLQDQGMEISNQVAKGMINGVPLITSAMNNLAKPVTVGLKGAASTNGVSSLQGGTQDNSVHVYIDGKEVTGTVMKRVQRELRGHGLKK